MTIVTILLAFFCDRYPNIQKLKHYHWLNDYAQMILRILPETKHAAPWWGMIVVCLPLLAAVFVLQSIGDHLWFGLGGFIFGLLVLIYCLGVSRISQYFMDIFNKTSSEPVTVEMKTLSTAEEANFIQSTHQEIFAIVFWFLLLGAVGACLYRMLLIFSKYAQSTDSQLAPYQAHIQYGLDILDWPSVRLLGLCLSLGGAFTKAFPLWWQNFFAGSSHNQVILESLAVAAAEQNTQEDIEQLFYRSIFIFLVILALMTLASWIS